MHKDIFKSIFLLVVNESKDDYKLKAMLCFKKYFMLGFRVLLCEDV